MDLFGGSYSVNQTQPPQQNKTLGSLEFGDIPEAIRDRSPAPPTPKNQASPTIPWKIALPAVLLAGGLFLVAIQGNFQVFSNSSPVVADDGPDGQTPPPGENVDNILGHLPYAIAPAESLTAVTADGRIKLRRKAAQKLQEMEQAARRDGISLALLSGFRTVEEQEYLFFEVKAQRGQDASTRAEVSAPPGYSEHHTGYAVDLGDGTRPQTHLAESFETTPAFQWLQNNAALYSFELSFPRNNPQGINYEPWHWRFVGDQESLETFYQAQQLENN